MRLFFGFNNLLKLQVGLLQHFLKVIFVLGLSRDRVGDLQLALAEDAAGDRDTLFGRMVFDTVRAFVSISAAIILIPPIRVFVAFVAEISVSTASESGQVAAEVTLELDMAEAMLLAGVLLADSHVGKSAALAHKLLFFHVLLVGLLGKLLVLAVNVATEEWAMAALALIKFAHVQGVLKRLLIETICWILQSRVVLEHIVLLKFFQGILTKSALENAHGREFLSDLRYRVGAIQVLLAAWALHEIEGDALCAPSMAQEFSDAACVEDVATVELHARLIAKSMAANLAIVKLG